ncbi:MAG: putative phage tail protein [Clostridiales bacterium]
MDYNKLLPPFYMEVIDFAALQDALNVVYDDVQYYTKNILDDISISTCSESRLAEWEQILGIIPQERDATQRRMMILATLRGTGKLNEDKIKTIVKTFSGGGCLVSFNNSKITVKISPPSWGEIFLFPDVEKALKPLIPAHLGLSVERYYNTWADRKKQHPTWGDIKNNVTDWGTVKNKVEAI